MEKLQANRVVDGLDLGIKTKNKKQKNFNIRNRKKNNKENYKNSNVTKKSNNILFEKFLFAVKSHKFSYIIYSLFLVTLITLAFLTFSNNTYFVFLKRPKVIENGFLLAIIIALFLLLMYVNFTLETILPLSSKNRPLKNENKVFKEEDKILEKDKKRKKNKLFIQKNAKKYDFKLYFIIFIQILALILAFDIQSLWLCVFICFCTFFTLFIKLFKSKKVQNKIVDIVIILNYLCILLSFYFIYLYN